MLFARFDGKSNSDKMHLRGYDQAKKIFLKDNILVKQSQMTSGYYEMVDPSSFYVTHLDKSMNAVYIYVLNLEPVFRILHLIDEEAPSFSG